MVLSFSVFLQVQRDPTAQQELMAPPDVAAMQNAAKSEVLAEATPVREEAHAEQALAMVLHLHQFAILEQRDAISHPHGFNLDAQSTFQHEGTILYVINTEPKGKQVEYPYGLCYVPGGSLALVDESKETGRVFLHFPGVLIDVKLEATSPRPGPTLFMHVAIAEKAVT